MTLSVFMNLFRRHTKAWIVFLATLVISVASIGLPSIYHGFIDTNPITDGHPLSDPRYGFQFYMPSYLPASFHIVDKRVSITDPDGEILGIGTELNLRSVDWVYAIRESNLHAPGFEGEVSSIQTSDKTYDPTSILPTCKQIVSPHHQLYRLCHWIDYGAISVFELKFVKDGTYFDTQFPGRIGQVVPEASLSAYVDSFKKASASGFHIVAGL